MARNSLISTSIRITIAVVWLLPAKADSVNLSGLGDANLHLGETLGELKSNRPNLEVFQLDGAGPTGLAERIGDWLLCYRLKKSHVGLQSFSRTGGFPAQLKNTQHIAAQLNSEFGQPARMTLAKIDLGQKSLHHITAMMYRCPKLGEGVCCLLESNQVELSVTFFESKSFPLEVIAKSYDEVAGSISGFRRIPAGHDHDFDIIPKLAKIPQSLAARKNAQVTSDDPPLRSDDGRPSRPENGKSPSGANAFNDQDSDLALPVRIGIACGVGLIVAFGVLRYKRGGGS